MLAAQLLKAAEIYNGINPLCMASLLTLTDYCTHLVLSRVCL